MHLSTLVRWMMHMQTCAPTWEVLKLFKRTRHLPSVPLDKDLLGEVRSSLLHWHFAARYSSCMACLLTFDIADRFRAFVGAKPSDLIMPSI